MSPMGNCAKFLRKISTSTITIGPPTTRRSSQRRHRDLATTIGGSLRFTRSTSQTVTPRPSTKLLFKSRFHAGRVMASQSEEHTSELQSLRQLVCRLLLE